jgi:hypothetical protein
VSEKFVCVKGNEVEVLSSFAGYYIGTRDDETGPCCKISVDYWKKKEDAQEALKTGNFQQRYDAPENVFCHMGQGCRITLVEKDD